MEKNVHLVAHLEYYCKTCRKIASNRVHEYDPVNTFEEMDAQLGHTNYPIIPFACTGCGVKHNPEAITLYDISSGRMVKTLSEKLGSPNMPIIGDANTPYGVIVSAEEEAEYERGLAKINDHFKEEEQAFWNKYFTFANEKWNDLIKELSTSEYAEAYHTLNLSGLHSTASTHAWRKDAERSLNTNEERRNFWKAANRYLVIEEFIWTPIDTWPIKEWVSVYGRERVTYLTLQLPLPEELEKYRTEKLGQIIRKKTGETGVLFERIGQLGRELEKQKNRSFQLGQIILDLRQENSKLQEQLAQTRRRQLEVKPVIIDRQADDARKIREFKALIREQREEIERLSVLIPRETESEGIAEEIGMVPAVTKEADLSTLAGKSILIVGWPNEEINDSYRVVWHDGDKVDTKLQALAREADLFVFLTRFGSHAAMWWLKEEAIEQNKPVYFVRERNLHRILAEVSC